MTRSNELGMPIWLSTSRFAPPTDILRAKQSIWEPSNEIVPAFMTFWRWVLRLSSIKTPLCQREARIPRISLNRSVIRMRAYAVRLLRLRRIEFSVHTGQTDMTDGRQVLLKSACEAHPLSRARRLARPAYGLKRTGRRFAILDPCATAPATIRNLRIRAVAVQAR